MVISMFRGDEDEDEIDPREWLKMEKENYITPCCVASLYFDVKASEWCKSRDEDTMLNTTWEVFKELFSNKWTKGIQMEVLHTIEDEFNEDKEEISKLLKDNEELKEELKKKVINCLRCNPLMKHSSRRLKT
jgi:hypothetical protein